MGLRIGTEQPVQTIYALQENNKHKTQQNDDRRYRRDKRIKRLLHVAEDGKRQRRIGRRDQEQRHGHVIERSQEGKYHSRHDGRLQQWQGDVPEHVKRFGPQNISRTLQRIVERAEPR